MIEATVRARQMLAQGFREASIDDVTSLFEISRRQIGDCEIQFFDADRIAGFDHLFFAVLNATRAFDSGLKISNSLAVETLLYASGQHQIKEAIRLLGVKRHSSRIVCLIIAEEREKALEAMKTVTDNVKGQYSDEVMELTEKKIENIKASYGISDAEIEATNSDSEQETIQKLVIERVALLMTRL